MPTLSRYLRAAIEDRSLRMLRTLSTSATLRAQMEAYGYSKADHDEGWKLCIAVAGFGRAAAPTSNEQTIRAAVERLADFVANDLPCLAAGVKRAHPEYFVTLFDGLTFGRGADAVLEATLFLARHEALASDATEKTGAVVAFFVTRGLTQAVVSDLKTNLELARSGPVAMALRRDDSAAQRDVDLLKLQAWLEDWTTTARRAITRKDELRRLGVVRRSRRKTTRATSGDAPALPVTAAEAPPCAESGVRLCRA